MIVPDMIVAQPTSQATSPATTSYRSPCQIRAKSVMAQFQIAVFQPPRLKLARVTTSSFGSTRGLLFLSPPDMPKQTTPTKAKTPKFNGQGTKDDQDLQKAKTKFLSYLREADTSNGGAEAVILKFHMSAQVQHDFEMLVQSHGCRLETRILTAAEQKRIDKRRSTGAQWTKVFVTRAAQDAYLGRSAAPAAPSSAPSFAEVSLASVSLPVPQPQVKDTQSQAEGGATFTEMDAVVAAANPEGSVTTPEVASSPHEAIWVITGRLADSLDHDLRNLQTARGAGPTTTATAWPLLIWAATAIWGTPTDPMSLLPPEIVELIVRYAWGCLSTTSYRHSYAMTQWMLVSHEWLKIVSPITLGDLWVTSTAHMQYMTNNISTTDVSCIFRLAGIPNVAKYLSDNCRSLTVSKESKLQELELSSSIHPFCTWEPDFRHSKSVAAFIQNYVPFITSLHFVLVDCHNLPLWLLDSYPLQVTDVHVTCAYTTAPPSRIYQAPRPKIFLPDNCMHTFPGVRRLVVRDVHTDLIAVITAMCPVLECIESTEEFGAEDLPSNISDQRRENFVFRRLAPTTSWGLPTPPSDSDDEDSLPLLEEW
ncbi:hypothetical protein FB45DRAFT_1061938 [Roridomyces roridus]|uniref:Uncharacterized protein n=1 Tax=Roridomyces roridus TaxID=1738132 RepID=A0AAD7BJ05_9AGAR|nr:hypothetical protein FB45DRAFT_1061938 [Roridomyces roridus]